MDKIVEINGIRVEKLNNDEFAQFIKTTINLIEEATLDKLTIRPGWLQLLKRYLDDLTEASRQNRQSSETESISVLDKKRGQLVVLLLSSFRNERNHILENRKEAATYLYHLTRNFAGTQSLPTRQKSQTISALLKDLRKPLEAEYISTLGLTEVVDTLYEYNSECQRLIESRAESQISEVKINTKKVRLEASKLYRGIVKYAFATNLLHPTKESSNFVGLLNKLISDTMLANKQRLAQASAKDSK